MASRHLPLPFRLAAEFPRLTRLAAFFLGGMTTFAFAPAELYWLAPLLILPLLFTTLTGSPREAGAHYFWYGLGLFLCGTYWIHISVTVFGNAPAWIAALLMVGLSLIMALFLRIAGWLTARFAHGEPWRLLLAGPAAWVLIEWLRGWAFSGFPWLAFGYAHTDSWFSGWAPVAGVYGVSFMVLFSGAGVLVALLTKGWQRLAAVTAVLLPWILGGILSGVQWTETTGDTVRATIVQGGVSQDRKWLPAQRRATMDFYRGALLDAPRSDLVVWPEVAIPAVDDQVSDFLDLLSADAKRAGQTLLLGILERSENGQIFNSVIALDGGERQSYRKRHLVPFGEYFPVPAGVREWMKMRNLPHSDLAAGDKVQPLLTTGAGIGLAVAICYEDAYGAEQLYAFPEADLIVNVSNDAWFGDSIAPHQHLQIARMRALEVGRASVRATNNGISAFIRADGTLLQSGRQFVSEIMTAELPLRRGETPYTRLGNWPAIGGGLVLLALLWIRSRTGI